MNEQRTIEQQCICRVGDGMQEDCPVHGREAVPSNPIAARDAKEWPQYPNRRDWPRLQYGVAQETVQRWVDEGSQAVADRHELLGQIERLTAELAHRDELEKFAAPLSCSTHGLVPNLALFDNKCPACERDRLKATVEELRTVSAGLEELTDRQSVHEAELAHENGRLRAALDVASHILAENMRSTTHWTGCESAHWMCRMGRLIENALAGNNRATSEQVAGAADETTGEPR